MGVADWAPDAAAGLVRFDGQNFSVIELHQMIEYLRGEGLVQFHAIDSQIRQYLDRDVSAGNTYEYALKVFTPKGSYSAMSQKVSWKVER